VVFYKDGIIVAQAPEILWIRDTDGDGKADKTEVLFTGWGTGDTHAVISNLRWGPDGWIYGSVGYSAGKVYSGDRKHFFGNINAGIYRFRPDGSAIEQIASSSCNTWGCEVAPDNEIFFSTATCGEPINHLVIPERIRARGSIPRLKSYLDIMEENKVYPPFKETREPYVQIDWVGQWTAAAGACMGAGQPVFLFPERAHRACFPPRVPLAARPHLPGPSRGGPQGDPFPHKLGLLVPAHSLPRWPRRRPLCRRFLQSNRRS
jgi:hypothetical protein